MQVVKMKKGRILTEAIPVQPGERLGDYWFR